MPTEIERTLTIIRENKNTFLDATPYLYELPETKWKYLHMSGCASRSMMQWLKNEYAGYRRLTKEEIAENKDPVFCLLAEPEYRWWTGVVEWSTNFGDYAWFKNQDIMECWPHFDRFTLRYSTIIEQVPNVQKMIRISPTLNLSMQDFARQEKLRLYGDLPYVKPRYRTVGYIKNMAEVLRPTLNKMMDKQPELRQKLRDYVQPDYKYYNKAV